MNRPVTHALALSFLVLAPILFAQPTLRRPRGIYTVVNVEDEINTLQQANPSITTAQLDAGFDCFYQNLLEQSRNLRAGHPADLGDAKSKSAGSCECLLLESGRRRLQPSCRVEPAESRERPQDYSAHRDPRIRFANGYSIRYPVATACLRRRRSRRPARAEKRPSPVSPRAVPEMCFLCPGIRCTRVPGKPF